MIIASRCLEKTLILAKSCYFLGMGDLTGQRRQTNWTWVAVRPAGGTAVRPATCGGLISWKINLWILRNSIKHVCGSVWMLVCTWSQWKWTFKAKLDRVFPKCPERVHCVRLGILAKSLNWRSNRPYWAVRPAGLAVRLACDLFTCLESGELWGLGQCYGFHCIDVAWCMFWTNMGHVVKNLCSKMVALSCVV